MTLVTEVLLVTGVALDLVGAGVLSHAHNAESIVELREEISEDGEDGSALGEPDAISTHARLLAEKRIGFLLLTVGLVIYLCGLVLKSPEGVATMAAVAAGAVIVGLVISVAFTKVAGDRIRTQARRASAQADPEAMPEQ